MRKKRYDKDILSVAEAATLKTGKYFLPSQVTPLQYPKTTLYVGVNAYEDIFIAKSKNTGAFEIIEVSFTPENFEFPSEENHGSDCGLPGVIKSEFELEEDDEPD